MSEEDLKQTQKESGSLEEARGDGRGVGGPRQGIGPARACKCPKCGKEYSKEVNVPCANKTCPDCGVALVGVD